MCQQLSKTREEPVAFLTPLDWVDKVLSWKINMAAALTRKSRLLAMNFPALVTQCCCPSAALTFSRIQVRCKGHSQWQNRKYKKAHNDFTRSKEFGKLSMEIITAVRGKAEFYYLIINKI